MRVSHPCMMHALSLTVAGLLTVALTWPSSASTTVPLGAGTACVMMSERDAREMLGLKKRHVLACANPNGTVTRVVLTRKGAVECTDTVQVNGSGEGSVAVGAAGLGYSIGLAVQWFFPGISIPA